MLSNTQDVVLVSGVPFLRQVSPDFKSEHDDALYVDPLPTR